MTDASASGCPLLSFLLGDLSSFQQDSQCGNGWLLPSQLQHQEGHVFRHQSVQQPRAVLGGPAHHLPLRLWPFCCSAGQLQEEIGRPVSVPDHCHCPAPSPPFSKTPHVCNSNSNVVTQMTQNVFWVYWKWHTNRHYCALISHNK